jgi:anti-anti-sigma factor
MLTMLNQGGAAPVTAGPALTAETVPELRERLLAAMAQGTTRLVVDCREVAQIDTQGLALLIAARNALAEAGATLCLANLGPEQVELLHFFQLERVVEIQPRANLRGPAAVSTGSV